MYFVIFLLKPACFRLSKIPINLGSILTNKFDKENYFLDKGFRDYSVKQKPFCKGCKILSKIRHSSKSWWKKVSIDIGVIISKNLHTFKDINLRFRYNYDL